MSIWRMLEYDSRAVEIGTAACGMALAIAWAVDGFAAWAAWPEWMQNPGGAIVWFAVSGLHAACVAYGRYRPREWFALGSAVLFAGVSGSAALNGNAPLAALSGVGAAGQAWAYLVIGAYHVDMSRRYSECPRDGDR